MGNWFSSLFYVNLGCRGADPKFLLLGLDCAGKTTILYKLRLGKPVKIIPTIGFNVETIEHDHFQMAVWDVGGQDKIRPLWRHYFQNALGVIFVVDSSDRERLAEAKEELQILVREEELMNSVFLVLANKQDLPNAMTSKEMVKRLGLEDITHVKWEVKETTGKTGEGVREGMDWLVGEIRRNDL
uniref:Uncharacterized protein n=1 Tax=Paramoeba aestuarina TaxID=180227 RepID=A0A7S4PBG8_9EUKA|mmetsp:Transcript_39184/g.62021  ORF Transcript_39184/g.62021 Transcript_39184/m.62021 type:complete len:185 (+) Transcript_39184:307-861(+)